MKTQNPGQRFKDHKNKLFQCFIEGFKVSKEQSNHKEQQSFYKISTFNKVGESYIQHTKGVRSDSVSRIECFLKDSFNTIGVSFVKRNGIDMVSILFQQETLTHGRHTSTFPKIIEQYRSQHFSFEEIIPRLKKFHKEVKELGKVSHIEISSVLIENLDMSMGEPPKYLNKKTTYDGRVFF